MILLKPYSGKDVVLDTNLLLLRVVGELGAGMIKRCNRTAQFEPSDFDLLIAVQRCFRCLVSTPNIITEVSHFLEELRGEYRMKAFESLGQVVAKVDERYVPSPAVLALDITEHHGVSDGSQWSLAQAGACLLSIDGPLVAWAQRAKLPAVNFYHLKFPIS